MKRDPPFTFRRLLEGGSGEQGILVTTVLNRGRESGKICGNKVTEYNFLPL